MNEAKPKEVRLACDMRRECQSPVTHIDEKGFIYCSDHGRQRQYSMRCRKLMPNELNRLGQGMPLESYEVQS